MTSIWDKPISHGEILKKIWKHLDLGVLEREHPFHTPVFATVEAGGGGCAPHLRVVVLRRFWRKNPRALLFHTHLDSPKIKEIQSNNRVSFLFYHPREKFQISVKGRAEIFTDGELHEEQWLATGFFSRRCYAGQTPGEQSPKPTTGLPEDLNDRKPTAEESEAGKANFAVVRSIIDAIDCLELDARGNRRSLFTWRETGELKTAWLTP